MEYDLSLWQLFLYLAEVDLKKCYWEFSFIVGESVCQDSFPQHNSSSGSLRTRQVMLIVVQSMALHRHSASKPAVQYYNIGWG